MWVPNRCFKPYKLFMNDGPALAGIVNRILKMMQQSRPKAPLFGIAFRLALQYAVASSAKKTLFGPVRDRCSLHWCCTWGQADKSHRQATSQCIHHKAQIPLCCREGFWFSDPRVHNWGIVSCMPLTAWCWLTPCLKCEHPITSAKWHHQVYFNTNQFWSVI